MNIARKWLARGEITRDQLQGIQEGSEARLQESSSTTRATLAWRGFEFGTQPTRPAE